MASIAAVNPVIITWAREYNDLTKADLAQTVGVHENQIIKWEDGVTKPTFTQATELAKALHIPFGYLFLTEPPNLEVPLPDLRTRKDHRLAKLSPSLREVLYGAFDRHDWYREYLQQYGLPKIPFVASFTPTNTPAEVAASIRDVLVVNEDERQKVRTWAAYLNLLCEKSEVAGILVMRSGIVGNETHRPLSADDFQGFAITDDIAPVVFINGADFVTAQIFTLAHELAHIWIGKSGISSLDEADIPTPAHHNAIEAFCNKVAVEVLVPRSEFLSAWARHEREFYELARQFWVSTLVVLRRAYELKKIKDEDFFPLLQRLKTERKPRRKGGRGDYYPNVAKRHSATFMDSIIKDVRSGGTPIRDAARLLDMSLPTFANVVTGMEF